MIDIIEKNYPSGEGCEIACLDKGNVRLMDVMPRLVPEDQACDQAIVQAARVSYAAGTKTVNEDRGLIRYLMRHRHSTPFEMVEFKFLCSMPVFVARQWIRHRTASVNEVSGRYSVIEDNFFIPKPDEIRAQSKTNKQGTEGQIEEGDAKWFEGTLLTACDRAYSEYEDALKRGVGREQARMILPVNIYTSWVWKIDCWNLLHFLSLRCDSHAQYEIRVFADAMLKLISPLVPYAIEAWNDYHPYRGAVTLSRLEWDKLRDSVRHIRLGELGSIDSVDPSVLALGSGNKREDAEWEQKLQSLGLL